MIALKTIDESNYRQCLQLRVSIPHADFADPVVYSLAEAWVFYEDTRPFAIVYGDEIIGFVSMYVGEEHHQIINFLIADQYRRMGLGTRAARLCLGFLEEQYHAVQVSLPVNPENLPALKFWTKLGFVPSDNEEDGYIFLRTNLAAQHRQAHALFTQAMKHIYGDGVPEDNALAVRLLNQAYALGHVEAAYNLGICCHYGYGTEADLAKAYGLYLESAERGCGKGMELVGRFYNRGIHVTKDRQQAEFRLNRAIQSGDPDAAEEAKKELALNR